MIDTIITVVSIAVAVATFIWGVKSYKDQMNAQLFLEFTRRFEEIMQSFPEDAWAARLNLQETTPESSKKLSLSVLKYMNLCSEEYYLYKKGWLNASIWRIWEAELMRTLQTPLMVREWKTLSREFDAYPAFQAFVEAVQGGNTHTPQVAKPSRTAQTIRKQ